MNEQRHSHQGLPEFHIHGAGQQSSRHQVVRFAWIATVIVFALLLLGLGRALFVRHAEADVLASRAAESAILQVKVVQPSTSGYESKLTLPSSLQGINQSQIYARTNGYVKQWFKDIGQPVKKGELLALLDIPDVNKQVEEANANYELAKIAYERWGRLREKDAVSQQEYDDKVGAFKQTEAVLKRLQDQQNFGKVVAPFEGIVTNAMLIMAIWSTLEMAAQGKRCLRSHKSTSCGCTFTCRKIVLRVFTSVTAWIFCEQMR